MATEFCAEWWAQFIEIRCYLLHFWNEMQFIWTRYLLDWWSYGYLNTCSPVFHCIVVLIVFQWKNICNILPVCNCFPWMLKQPSSLISYQIQPQLFVFLRFFKIWNVCHIKMASRDVSHCIVLKIEIHLWSTCLTNYCQDSHGLFQIVTVIKEKFFSC